MNKILNINELNSEKTLIINVDMINGFITEGALHCSNIKRIVSNILELNKKLDKSVIRFFADAHEHDSLEFKTFPKHCLIGSTESQIIEELEELAKSNVVYYKSTTNGFWSYEFKKFLEYNSFENIILTGCCTDICILNLALTLNTYFISINEDVNIIVVEDAVDTFDAPGHNADTYNIMSLNILKSNGIQVLRLHKQEEDSLKLYPLTNEQRFTLECEIESMLDCDTEDTVREDAQSALDAISSTNINIVK